MYVRYMPCVTYILCDSTSMQVCQYYLHQMHRRLECLIVLPVFGAYPPIADGLGLADRTASFSTSLKPPPRKAKAKINTHDPCSQVTNGYVSSKTMAYFSPTLPLHPMPTVLLKGLRNRKTETGKNTVNSPKNSIKGLRGQ